MSSWPCLRGSIGITSCTGQPRQRRSGEPYRQAARATTGLCRETHCMPESEAECIPKPQGGSTKCSNQPTEIEVQCASVRLCPGHVGVALDIVLQVLPAAAVTVADCVRCAQVAAVETTHSQPSSLPSSAPSQASLPNVMDSSRALLLDAFWLALHVACLLPCQAHHCHLDCGDGASGAVKASANEF